jgi:NOL1/NOP2/fmu family ribosome biogenesis protein
MDFLNSKQRKVFFKQLTKQYGYDGSTDYALYYGGGNKVFVVSSDIDKVPFLDLRPKMAGLYVAEMLRDQIRLTMDGSMLFGPHCHNCFIEFSTVQKDAWMRGEDIPTDIQEAKYILAKWEDKILGCGHAANESIKPYVSKGRRISDPH